jgi:hypothetical protein
MKTDSECILARNNSRRQVIHSSLHKTQIKWENSQANMPNCSLPGSGEIDGRFKCSRSDELLLSIPTRLTNIMDMNKMQNRASDT